MTSAMYSHTIGPKDNPNPIVQKNNPATIIFLPSSVFKKEPTLTTINEIKTIIVPICSKFFLPNLDNRQLVPMITRTTTRLRTIGITFANYGKT